MCSRLRTEGLKRENTSTRTGAVREQGGRGTKCYGRGKCNPCLVHPAARLEVGAESTESAANRRDIWERHFRGLAVPVAGRALQSSSQGRLFVFFFLFLHRSSNKYLRDAHS